MTTPLFQIPKPIMENMKPECLRAAIDCGTFKPGYSWRKGVAQNKGYKIATIPFYLWYTQSWISAELF